MAFEQQYVCNGKIEEDGTDNRHYTYLLVLLRMGDRYDETIRKTPSCNECGDAMKEVQVGERESDDWRGTVSHS